MQLQFLNFCELFNIMRLQFFSEISLYKYPVGAYSRTQSSEVILFPTLRIYFVDFPYQLHFLYTRGRMTLWVRTIRRTRVVKQEKTTIPRTSNLHLRIPLLYNTFSTSWLENFGTIPSTVSGPTELSNCSVPYLVKLTRAHVPTISPTFPTVLKTSTIIGKSN